RYGARVPALIVSPWIEPGSASHTLFDHTSIIKTILLRFCPDALRPPTGREAMPALRRPGDPRYLGVRVAQANDLATLLTLAAPRPAPPRSQLIDWAAKREKARTRVTPGAPGGLPRAPATELQIRIAAASRELRRLGHPEGRP
ncbi:MAG: hypothetical protein JOZ69_17635, partial [Myxococcales bacterium]|nr:hypothetical protein [Myxococcales bacterium]